jgi:hypothetical protein
LFETDHIMDKASGRIIISLGDKIETNDSEDNSDSRHMDDSDSDEEVTHFMKMHNSNI